MLSGYYVIIFALHYLSPLPIESNKYLCWRRDCSWPIADGEYIEGTDYGFYSHNNSDCTLCQTLCDLDPRCGAVNCAGKSEPPRLPRKTKLYGKGCMWWRVGACVDDYRTHTHEHQVKLGYLCYKGE